MENLKLYSLKRTETEIQGVKITSYNEAYEVARNFYEDDIEIYESFFCLFLNRANKTIGYAKISQGTTVGTLVDLKLIAKYAIDCLANSVILVHNHPSGNLSASNEDKKLTEKVKESLKLFDIEVLDHLILTKNSYFSFAERGLI